MEAFGVNKRDAMNQIRQFGSKFDRLRNAAGGGGGGRPNMAQAGGKNPAGVEDALRKAEEVIAEQVK